MEKGKEENMKKGDIVRLKSGGPSMTVLITDDKTTECQWFTLSGEMCREPFSNDTLEPCGATDLTRSLISFLDRSELNIRKR